MKTLASGYLRMLSHKEISPVEYNLVTVEYNDDKEKESELALNPFIGKKMKWTFSGEIRCVHCGKKSKKSFAQGNCYPCFISLAKNDLCILKPETCHHHLGTCREPEWGLKNCFKKHTVYLANSTGIKVGITKENPIQKRWIDQGATQGIAMVEVQSRRDAGIIESHIAKYVTDKTSWQKLIQSDAIQLDMIQSKEELLSHLNTIPEKIDYKLVPKAKPVQIQFPIQAYPPKVKSYKYEGGNEFEDQLIGIKGQYLLFSNGVINIRSASGYHVSVSG